MNVFKQKVVLALTGIMLVLLFSTCVKEMKPLPQADFSYVSEDECTLPKQVTFENLSHNASVYRWDFGDGSPVSYEEHPLHTYTSEGNYMVTLTAYGPGGTHESAMPVYVVTTPVSTFYTNDTIVEVGDTAHFFSSTTSCLPSTWLWSFGDGFTSTLQNPAHVYSYPGTYTVVLTSTNACGATYVVMNNYVVVSNSALPPLPEFTANVTNINTGGTVNFTDLSLNSPNAWFWTFQGGQPVNSNVQHPSGIVYNNAGTYFVKLKVFNAAGTDSLTKVSYINVVPSGAAPVANFTASATNVTVGSSVTFTDLSLNSPTSWAWQFQSGTPATSTQQNPTVVYNTPGTFSVSLTATNAIGSDIETKQFYITVNPSIITQVLIKKITVENMPFPVSPPMFRNPYYQITNSFNTVLRNGRNEYLPTISFGMMPISWMLTPYFPVNQLNTQLKIRLWDWRSIQTNDIFVSEVLFNMINYTNPPNAYPPTVTLMQNQTKIILDLQWQ